MYNLILLNRCSGITVMLHVYYIKYNYYYLFVSYEGYRLTCVTSNLLIRVDVARNIKYNISLHGRVEMRMV